jgi:hypothetical protein
MTRVNPFAGWVDRCLGARGKELRLLIKGGFRFTMNRTRSFHMLVSNRSIYRTNQQHRIQCSVGRRSGFGLRYLVWRIRV